MTQNQPGETTAQLYLVADQLRTMANTGITHTDNPFERERCEKRL